MSNPALFYPLVFEPHDKEKFETYIEDGDNGFYLKSQNLKYYYDAHKGWADSNGCYYNADGEPAGWIILSADKKHQVHFDMNYSIIYEGQPLGKYGAFQTVIESSKKGRGRQQHKKRNHTRFGYFPKANKEPNSPKIPSSNAIEDNFSHAIKNEVSQRTPQNFLESSTGVFQEGNNQRREKLDQPDLNVKKSQKPSKHYLISTTVQENEFEEFLAASQLEDKKVWLSQSGDLKIFDLPTAIRVYLYTLNHSKTQKDALEIQS